MVNYPDEVDDFEILVWRNRFFPRSRGRVEPNHGVKVRNTPTLQLNNFDERWLRTLRI
jgi:hypothetical protein